MKVLFVNPKNSSFPLNISMLFPPQALLILASAVELRHSVRIFDLELHSLGLLKKIIPDFDIIAVTANTASIDDALLICRLAKSNGKLTIIGGIHATLNPELADKDEIDYLIAGEGEAALVGLLDALEKGRGVKAGPQDIAGHLVMDSLPLENYSLIEESRYHAFGLQLAVINSSRGCPHCCSFCCTPQAWQGKWRSKSPERVITEIQRLPTGTEAVFFTDDNFCHDMHRIDKVCDGIISHKLSHIYYGFEARADSIAGHPEIVKKMARAGFRQCVMGIESYNEDTLRSVGKGESRRTISRALSILESSGIMVWGTFMLGLPGENEKDIASTMRLACNSGVELAQFTFATPFPGTGMHKQMIAKGNLLVKPMRRYNALTPLVIPDGMSEKMLVKLMVEAYWSFYNPYSSLCRLASLMLYRKKRWLLVLMLRQSARILVWYFANSAYFAYKAAKKLLLPRKLVYVTNHPFDYLASFLAGRKKGKLFWNIYTYFRWVDDIIDDQSLPLCDKRYFISEQIEFIDGLGRRDARTGRMPASYEKRCLADTYRQYATFGRACEFVIYARGMLSAFEFDAERIGKPVSWTEFEGYSRKICDCYAFVVSTIFDLSPYESKYGSMAKKTFGKDVHGVLQEFIHFCHILHTLRDSELDRKLGYINFADEKDKATISAKLKEIRRYFDIIGSDAPKYLESHALRLFTLAFHSRFKKCLDSCEHRYGHKHSK